MNSRQRLRGLQRQHHVSVVLVHHARKGGGTARPGQTLRGSSELHAWGDCNLYLQRTRERLTLTVEHRAAAAPEPMNIELRGDGDDVELRVVAEPTAPSTVASNDPVERVVAAIRDARVPVTVRELLVRCAMRTDTLCRTLADLCRDGRVTKLPAGYVITAT